MGYKGIAYNNNNNTPMRVLSERATSMAERALKGSTTPLRAARRCAIAATARDEHGRVRKSKKARVFAQPCSGSVVIDLGHQRQHKSASWQPLWVSGGEKRVKLDQEGLLAVPCSSCKKRTGSWQMRAGPEMRMVSKR